MRRTPPLTASVLFLLAFLFSSSRAQELPAQSADPSVVVGISRKAPGKGAPGKADAGKKEEEPALEVNPDYAAYLKGVGFRIDPKDASIEELSSKRRIASDLLMKAGYTFGPGGMIVQLVNENSGMAVDRKLLPEILKGLLDFSDAGAIDPAQAGKKLQAWGVPPVYDGKHLVNPDGTATYFGLMVYQGMSKNPPATRRALSGERLSKALDLFQSAFQQAFGESAPNIATGDLQRGWGMLGQSKLQEGETALKMRPYDLTKSLNGYQAEVMKEAKAVLVDKGGDAAYKKDVAYSLAALNALEKHRYHTSMDLKSVPSPDGEDLRGALKKGLPAAPPPASLLPSVIKVLDKLNGKPLRSEQVEWLIKSFPMGETVWRMGAYELWRAGLTGKNVKVAVVDSGVGIHPELNSSVKSRDNFTTQQGKGTLGVHATHVAGTIHAIAPDAEIRSYKGLDDRNPDENRRLAMGSDETLDSLMKAVDKAVADGNQVVSLSLGGSGSPSGPLAAKIEEYAKKGVIFIVAAGNEGGTGVNSPSIAPSAVTVGALTAQNRVATFSSYGEVFDPAKLNTAIKTVHLAPGTNIVSTYKEGGYVPMDGTSMATPHVSGAVALLVQGVRDIGKVADPVAMSRKIRDALAGSGKPVARNTLPADVPPDQQFLVVDPVAAWRKSLSPKS